MHVALTAMACWFNRFRRGTLGPGRPVADLTAAPAGRVAYVRRESFSA
ncbi:hypothetical protein [Rhodobacter sp. NSM]